MAEATRFTVSIDTGNDAFEGDRDREIARILRKLADRLESCNPGEGPLYDVNGNTVGSWEDAR